MYDPHAKPPEELVEDCNECGGDGWCQELSGVVEVLVTCRACGGSGLALKDDNLRRRKNREPDHDPAEDRLPDPSREP